VSRSGLGGPTALDIESQIGDERRLRDLSVVVLATESSYQVDAARSLLRSGVTVVSTADRPDDVKRLLALEDSASAARASIIVGAAFSPGVSSLLVAHLASYFEQIDVITTARFGTGGPTCAREHHRSMGAAGREIRSAQATRMRAGTGRRLVWFPEPAEARDCYRAGLCEPTLLQRSFPAVRQIQGLQAATRRDRLTARLPMLRPPHPEGLIGATWVEVRGTTASGAVEHRVMAATAPQATGAAAAAAVMAGEALASAPTPGVHTVVSVGSEWASAAELLSKLGQQVTLWSYDGSAIASESGPEALRAARKWQRGRNRLLTNIEIGPRKDEWEDLPKVVGPAADYSP